MRRATIHRGDALDVLRGLPAGSAHCCVTSPPYWSLRDYGVEGQLGLEATPDEYVEKLVEVFREVRRVLRDDGTLWLNLGDSYAGSWGAQSRGDDYPGGLEGSSTLSARQIAAHPKGAALTGSLKRTPGLKSKDLVGIPWMVAFALRADGWYLRSDIVWAKPNPMPESVRDRPTKAHEYLFLLTKSPRYYFDQEAVREPHAEGSLARARRNRFGGKYDGSDPAEHGAVKRGDHYGPDGDPDKVCHPSGRNIRSVWTVPTHPFPEAHFATFPPALVEPCVLAGCPEGGTVIDHFAGAGTTGLVALRLGRSFVGIELSPEYAAMARRRIREDAPLLNSVEVVEAEGDAA